MESGNTTTNTTNPSLVGTTPIGDPVMASVMNGATPSTVNTNNTNSTSSTSTVPPYNLFSNTDHEFDFPFPTSSTWDIMGDDLTTGWGTTDSTTGATTTTTSSRPDSRPHSAATTPVSTPRPLSASPHVPPSPLHQQSFIVQQSQQSPANNHHSNFNSTQPQYGCTMDDVNHSFKMEDSSPSGPAKETNSVLDESLNESGRLRNLLTKKPTDCQPSPSTSTINNNNNSEDGKHRILKDLLNKDDDDDESKHDIKMSLQTLSVLGMASSSQSNQEQPKNPGSNHMLLKVS